MLVSLTVGKVDAGVTVLLTQDKRLIEFPSILLPPNISSGSIVDITVGRNQAAEKTADAAFASLQRRILDSFGTASPSAPVLRCRNATQTSVVLEWDPVQLATAELLGLALYRNGQKAGNIPRPLHMYSTKISGLAVDTAYTFHLVLRTSAGTLSSEHVTVRTHKMTDLSGITISTGILPGPTRQRLAAAVERIGARLVPEPGVVRIDTTHFVTTEGRGVAWEKATELNIPVVRPEWVEACEASGRILGVTKFYLDAVRGPSDLSDSVLSASTTLPPTTVLPPSTPVPPATRPSASQDDARQSKELPAAPGSGDDENSSTSSRSRSRSGNGVGGGREEKKAAHHPGDEQKVLVGDEQKMALRPGPGQGQAEEDGDGDDGNDDDDNHSSKNAGIHKGKQAADELKVSTPGDGNSFQDVDL